MALTLEEIERLHRQGKMPDWAYYQQNGKSAQANWEEQRAKMYERLRQQEEERRLEKELEKKLEKQIEEKLEKCIDKALNDLLKNLSI